MPFWRLLLAFQIYFGYMGFLETAAQGAGRLCDGYELIYVYRITYHFDTRLTFTKNVLVNSN